MKLKLTDKLRDIFNYRDMLQVIRSDVESDGVVSSLEFKLSRALETGVLLMMKDMLCDCLTLLLQPVSFHLPPP